MRKYFALITEHVNPRRVGLIEIRDSPFPTLTKNEEGVIQTYNHDEEAFGSFRAVGAGYYDFENEADVDARIDDVLDDKLRELDAKWHEKAGMPRGWRIARDGA